jgi:hypothetical protein
MKRIRIERPKPAGRPTPKILPLDPRDPKLLRAKGTRPAGLTPRTVDDKHQRVLTTSASTGRPGPPATLTHAIYQATVEEEIMNEPIAASIIRRIVAETATSALPDAPVRPDPTPRRRSVVAHLRRLSARLLVGLAGRLDSASTRPADQAQGAGT